MPHLDAGKRTEIRKRRVSRSEDRDRRPEPVREQPGKGGGASEPPAFGGYIFRQVSDDEEPGLPRILIRSAPPIRESGIGGAQPLVMLVWTSLIARDKRRALLSLSGTVLGALFFVHLANFYGWTIPWVIGGVPVAFFVIRSAGATALFLGRHPFSVCDLGLSEAAVPGGTIHCAFRIVTRRPAEIKDVRITLSAEQRDPDGTNRKVLSQDHELSRNRRLPAAGRWEAASELPVPEDARFSYRSFEGRFRWLVRARLETSDATVAEEEIEVLIAPAE